MEIKEYNTYFELMYSKDTTAVINGESKDAISKLRNKIAMTYARVGQELAIIKNDIDKEFQKLTESGSTATAAVRLSETNINAKAGVSRRDLQYMREALLNFSNSCSSRLNVLINEKEG